MPKEIAITKDIVKTDKNLLVVSEETIRDYLFGCGTKLTEQEQNLFLSIALENNLNPFKREIYPVKYGDKLDIVTGYEAYLRNANRSGLLNGWKVEFQGNLSPTKYKKFKKNQNKWVDIEGWESEKGNNFKAIITIWRKDFAYPFIHEVEWFEYNLKNSMWHDKPKTMLRKVAIGQGMRLCFAEDCKTLPYLYEEIQNEDEKIKDKHTKLELPLSKIEQKPEPIEASYEDVTESTENIPETPETVPPSAKVDESNDNIPEEEEKIKEQQNLYKQYFKELNSAIKDGFITKEQLENVYKACSIEIIKSQPQLTKLDLKTWITLNSFLKGKLDKLDEIILKKCFEQLELKYDDSPLEQKKEYLIKNQDEALQIIEIRFVQNNAKPIFERYWNDFESKYKIKVVESKDYRAKSILIRMLDQKINEIIKFVTTKKIEEIFFDKEIL